MAAASGDASERSWRSREWSRSSDVRAPGTLESHYAPTAQVLLVEPARRYGRLAALVDALRLPDVIHSGGAARGPNLNGSWRSTDRAVDRPRPVRWPRPRMDAAGSAHDGRGVRPRPVRRPAPGRRAAPDHGGRRPPQSGGPLALAVRDRLARAAPDGVAAGLCGAAVLGSGWLGHRRSAPREPARTCRRGRSRCVAAGPFRSGQMPEPRRSSRSRGTGRRSRSPSRSHEPVLAISVRVDRDAEALAHLRREPITFGSTTADEMQR